MLVLSEGRMPKGMVTRTPAEVVKRHGGGVSTVTGWVNQIEPPTSMFRVYASASGLGFERKSRNCPEHPQTGSCPCEISAGQSRIMVTYPEPVKHSFQLPTMKKHLKKSQKVCQLDAFGWFCTGFKKTHNIVGTSRLN